MSKATPRGKVWGNCSVCNGFHDSPQCPKRITIKGHYYRLLSVKEFAKRRRTALRKDNRDIKDAWRDLDRVSLWCPHTKTMLPISSAPYVGRMFVEAVRKS